MADLSIIARSLGMPDGSHALWVANAIDLLRIDEGSTVTFVSDNADFGGPNSVVVCNGRWTSWSDREFFADTAFAALQAAGRAYCDWLEADDADEPANPQGSGPAPIGADDPHDAVDAAHPHHGDQLEAEACSGDPINLQGSGPAPIAPREGYSPWGGQPLAAREG